MFDFVKSLFEYLISYDYIGKNADCEWNPLIYFRRLSRIVTDRAYEYCMFKRVWELGHVRLFRPAALYLQLDIYMCWIIWKNPCHNKWKILKFFLSVCYRDTSHSSGSYTEILTAILYFQATDVSCIACSNTKQVPFKTHKKIE